MSITAFSKDPIQSERTPRRSGPSPSSPFHTMALILLMATIFAAPWAFGAVQPWGWGALIALVFLTLVVWAVGSVQSGVLQLSWQPMYWPLLGFLLVAGVQFLGGLTVDRIATREAILKLLANAVLFFLAGQLLLVKPHRGVFEWWGLTATVLALALSSLALAQFITTGPGLIYWSVPTRFGPFGPYVSANDYCGLMELLLPLAAGFILADGLPGVPRFLLWLSVGVSLASIVVSASRAGAIVVLLELLLFGFIIFRYSRSSTWRRAFPITVAVILISAAAAIWVTKSEWRGSRALSVFQTNSSLRFKFGDRLWVAGDALRVARHHPWLGAGVGTFETVFPAYMTHASDLHWTHAHNDFAEALAETGLAGGLLMLWALLLFVRQAMLHFRESSRRRGVGWIAIGAVVGTVGLLCHSLVDFNLRIPANAAWFVLCLALVMHPVRTAGPSLRVVREAVPEPDGAVSS